MDCFEELVSPRKPIRNSYRVMDRVYVGEYPIEYDDKKSTEKIKQFEKFGITHYIDLTEEGEHLPYANMLKSDVQHIRFPIKDMSAPHNIESVKELTSRINEILHERDGNKIYIHCWGGVGRTGMIVGCLLSEQCGFDFEKTMDALTLAYSDCPNRLSGNT